MKPYQISNAVSGSPERAAVCQPRVGAGTRPTRLPWVSRTGFNPERVASRAQGNKVAPTSAFPNEIWERGVVGFHPGGMETALAGGKTAKRSQPPVGIASRSYPEGVTQPRVPRGASKVVPLRGRIKRETYPVVSRTSCAQPPARTVAKPPAWPNLIERSFDSERETY
jgi:hypothetical protein